MKSNNQGVKEDTFIQTGRKSRLVGKPSWAERTCSKAAARGSGQATQCPTMQPRAPAQGNKAPNH